MGVQLKMVHLRVTVSPLCTVMYLILEAINYYFYYGSKNVVKGGRGESLKKSIL